MDKRNVRKIQKIDVPSLIERTKRFLEKCYNKNLLGSDFIDAMGECKEKERFTRLLEICGYVDDPDGFFSEITRKVRMLRAGDDILIEFCGVKIPYLFLSEIMVVVSPGEGLITIRDVAQLEKVTKIEVPMDKRKEMQEVIDTYPVRFSKHALRQMRLSKDIAFQYMPFVDELDPEGLINTWVGQFHKGLLERMYLNRPIFVLNMSCPVYCRFCFRKHKSCRDQPAPAVKDVREAIRYIATHQEIKEVVLTGGDVFMNKLTLVAAIEGLKIIPHLQTLRIATRNLSYYPDMFYKNDGWWMTFLLEKNAELRGMGKRIEIATHFIFPEEVSSRSLELVQRFVQAGIPVYVQTPYLKGCTGAGLIRLYSLLRSAGAEMHYIYIPCSAIQGNKRYWAPLSEGVSVASALRAGLSDRAIPRICVATPIGKIDMGTSGWPVEPGTQKGRIWIRTPYSVEYLERFCEKLEMNNCRLNDEGTLDYHHMVPKGIGDEGLYHGARKPLEVKLEPLVDMREVLSDLQDGVLSDQRDLSGIVQTGIKCCARKHMTQVEVDILGEGLSEALAYVFEDERITDVVLSAKDGCIGALDKCEEVAKKLKAIKHVTALRLREYLFTYRTESFTEDVIERLSKMSVFSISDPLRVEIETQFLHMSEFCDNHKILTDLLRRKGITVYANSQLLFGVNDFLDGMQKISYQCREKDIEFHHVYVCGCGLQDKWNKERIDAGHVLDIATFLRRHGSGREIPRIVLRTFLGVLDFNLTSKFVKKGVGVCLWALPFDKGHFSSMDKGFSWPDGVEEKDGHPLISFKSMVFSDEFLLR